MGYIDKNLVPNEKVIYETRLHWIVMLGHIVAAILLALAGGSLLYYTFSQKGADPSSMHAMEGGGIVLLIGAVIAFLMGIIRRNATEIAVTNRRVVIKKGIASRNTIEMLLDKVQSIEVHQTVAGRMMGYGTIRVTGTGGTLEPFPKIAHPLEFRNELQQQIENHARATSP